VEAKKAPGFGADWLLGAATASRALTKATRKTTELALLCEPCGVRGANEECGAWLGKRRAAAVRRHHARPEASINFNRAKPTVTETPAASREDGRHTVTINFTSCCKAILTERLRRGWRWSRQGCLGEARCEENAVRADATQQLQQRGLHRSRLHPPQRQGSEMTHRCHACLQENQRLPHPPLRVLLRNLQGAGRVCAAVTGLPPPRTIAPASKSAAPSW